MPGKNPPRKTSIRGQRHMLAYITPDEAALLKARGGSGEKVNGIPAFFDVGEGAGGYGSPGAADYGGDDRGDGPRGGRGGGRARAGMSTARGPGGQFGGGGREDRPRQIDVLKAKAQTQAQIDAAKKAREAAEKKAKTQGLVESFIDYITPGRKITDVQNVAAQVMGERFKNILETDPKATVVRSNGRVTGVRDQYGRLTGRDPAQERIDAQDRGDATEERRRRLAAATPPPSDEAQEKRVIRSALAIESEAERARGRRLGRRSLLSRATRLGA